MLHVAFINKIVVGQKQMDLMEHDESLFELVYSLKLNITMIVQNVSLLVVTKLGFRGSRVSNNR